MSAAYVGELVTIDFQLDDPSQATGTTVQITLIHPDGSTDTLDASPGTGGAYKEIVDTTDLPAGHYAWVAHATGTAQAVAVGGFDLYDPTSAAPLLADVGSWCDSSDIRRRHGCGSIDQALLDDAAAAASYVLWALTGRQFAGRRVTTVRPTARNRWLDGPSWAAYSGYGWFGSWGSCSSAVGSGFGASALAAWGGHSCSCSPAEVELGTYPVTAILAVKIDGETIPDTEYRIDSHRVLVRTSPTAQAQPTARSGWPTCQRLDLPDTEDGTFSVRFAYGTQPPRAGALAATSLAAELALLWDDSDSQTRLPARVQTIARQGETITVIDPQDVLDNGRTGLPDVDLFIKAVNPAGLQRRASVWTPDLGRARRPS